MRGVAAAPADRPRSALRQVLQDLKAKEVEELAAEEDAWLLAFFQGAPHEPPCAAVQLHWRMSPYAHKVSKHNLLEQQCLMRCGSCTKCSKSAPSSHAAEHCCEHENGC